MVKVPRFFLRKQVLNNNPCIVACTIRELFCVRLNAQQTILSQCIENVVNVAEVLGSNMLHTMKYFNKPIIHKMKKILFDKPSICSDSSLIYCLFHIYIPIVQNIKMKKICLNILIHTEYSPILLHMSQKNII